ncbi:MAG: Flp pilus assembly complex ATPase component TadA, partial [Desulfobacteraceae bacterium]|nr:Flp pilus assembly complex ATPase component TadA [Desulfobacteraceae bacterium]
MARLGDSLIKQKIITKQELELALKEQKRTKELLGEIVVRLGFATRKDLSKAVAKSSDLSFIELKDVQIDPTVVKIIDSSIARRFFLMPFSLVDEVLYVAMDNPNDIRAIDIITKTTGFEVESFASDKEEILNAINLYYDIGENFDDEIEKNVTAALAGGIAAEGEANPPIVRLVDLFIAEGLRRTATDIHISPEERAVRISYRVDGILQNTSILPKKLHSSIVTRVKIIGNMDIAEQRLPQEGGMNFEFMDREVDIRVSTSPSTNGENIVLRLLDKGNVALELEHLGFSREKRKQVERLANLPYGIVLVAGPTGSGKTTTLYSLLKEINTFEKNVLTIEDPVEYE